MIARALIGAALALCAAGCVTATAPAHQPTLANVQALRAADIPAIQLGEFRLAPGLRSAIDRMVDVRGSVLRAPNGSFALYLRQTLEQELVAAGKLDAASGVVISAHLMQSEVSTNVNRTGATVGARFVVTRDGATVYDRALLATDDWEFQFIGAIAIPEAMDRYTALYPALVTQLLQDPAFRAAVAAPAG